MTNLPPPTETNSQAASSKPTCYLLSSTEEEFIGRRDLLPNGRRAFLTPHSLDDYIKMEADLYLSDTKSSGFGIKPDGELISVFSLPGAEEGDEAIEAAIKAGAKRLDCLGEFLREFYEGHGFEVKSWDNWDDKFRPDNWSEEENGQPNVYYMELREI